MSLRLRVVLVVVLTSLCALVGAEVLVYRFTRDALIERARQSASETSISLSMLLGNSQGHPAPGPGPAPTPVVVPGSYVARLTPDGRIRAQLSVPDESGATGPGPELPGQVLRATAGSGAPLVFLASPPGADAPRYVVRIAPDRGSRLVTAVPLTQVERTLQQIRDIEQSVALVAALALLAVGYPLATLSLSPLERVRRTAVSVSQGDLTGRVPVTHRRSEIGRLAGTFNEMLDHLQDAFAATADTEARLRRFISDASHELRTPVTSLLGYADLLGSARELPVDDHAVALRRIGEEARRMQTMVDELVLMARFDHAPQLRFERVDVARLVTEAGRDALLTPGPLTVTVDGRPVVRGDGDALRRVLANLLKNARQHAPAGTPVRLSAGVDGDLVRICVEDDAPGPPDPDPAELFEPFRRGLSATAPGSGLGLAIVRSIVQAHQGAIAMTSTVDRCRVEVTLPGLS